jgi:hypothetical protein
VECTETHSIAFYFPKLINSRRVALIPKVRLIGGYDKDRTALPERHAFCITA